MIFGRLKTLASTAVLSVLFATPSLGENISMQFNISYGFAKLGEMHFDVETTGNRYKANGRLFTTGIVSSFFDIEFTNTSNGRERRNGNLRPVLYSSFTEQDGEVSEVVIEYTGKKVSHVFFDPERDIQPFAIGLSDSVDPSSLVYLIVRPVSSDRLCVGEYTMFDGEVISEIIYTGMRHLKGGLVECLVSYEGTKFGGFSISALVFAPNEDGMAYIKRFSIDTPVGKLIARVK